MIILPRLYKKITAQSHNSKQKKKIRDRDEGRKKKKKQINMHRVRVDMYEPHDALFLEHQILNDPTMAALDVACRRDSSCLLVMPSVLPS